MAMWQWEGTSAEGDFRRGEVDAANKAEARTKLKQQGVNIIKLKRKQLELDLTIPGLGGGVPTKNMVIFTRQMATMIDAGLPLVQALDLVGNSEPHPQLKKTILGVKASVEGGSSFSDALKRYPKVFEELYVNLVQAGEMGGILDTIMNRLAEYIEKAAETQKKIKGAMKYPLTVLTVSLAITVGLLWKVVPSFASTFQSMGAKLPGITQAVVDISDGFLAKAPFLGAGLVALGVAYKLAMKTKQGPYIRDWLLFHGPIIGNVVQKGAVAKFTRTLGTLVAAGVPIIEALAIVGKTSGNLVVERGVDYTRNKIMEGRNVTGPLMETQIFPVMVVQMIAVGEATGAMDVMLGKIADFYDSEVDEAIDGMTSMMEPLIMLVLGGIVGTIMIALYAPIFTMGDNIK
ncbi:MAG: type II secretion system F family protein [Deltaproteobacteria bacterium]|nr:type II secretion system F family protein [Deltaproteobacteria bacterium]